MSFYSELDPLKLEELIVRFKMPPLEGEEYAPLFYQEIANLIRAKGEIGISFLEEEIDRADPARLQAIIFALTLPPRLDNPKLKKRLLCYLQDDRPMIVMEAVDGLSRQGEKDAISHILALREHSSPYVRGSVLRFMRCLYPDRALPILIEALNDPHFLVRENAADEIGELDAVEAIPYLLPLLKDPHYEVQQAAQTAIETLESMPEPITTTRPSVVIR